MMSSDFHFREKVPVAILGATGLVGQKFIELLAQHPWFEIADLAASEKSVGKTFCEAVNWKGSSPIPEEIGEKIIKECRAPLRGSLIFSGLDSKIAGDIEAELCKDGYLIVTNASAHRMNENVPLLIPEVNSHHLELLNQQKGKGKIVANPNCSVIGLCLALKPLHQNFELESVQIVTMQSASGAGYPGVPSLDILDNIIPFIEGEEEKVEVEPRKILGDLKESKIHQAQINFSAQCNRVPVRTGHMACVSVKFKKKTTKEEIIKAWQTFKGQTYEAQLFSSPEHVLIYHSKNSLPQPALQKDLGKGMSVSIGRLEESKTMDYRFVILSHNTLRGAAGGAILCAEMLLRKGYIFW